MIWYLLFILLFLDIRFAFPQPYKQWVARYDGPLNRNDEVLAMAIDKLGNVYVTGKSIGISTNHDYCTIKYNSTGQQLWLQRYNGEDSLHDIANAIALDDSGNVYVTGSSLISMGKYYDYDYVTIKYNTNGVEQWVSVYDSPLNGYDIASSICLDEDANVYVTGYYGMTTIKYDRNGSQQWSATYNVSAENRAYKVVYKNGFVYVTGYSYVIGANQDFVTIKYNALTGIQQWAARYNGTNRNDKASCVAVDNSDNVYVGGASVGSSNMWNAVVIKYNSSGAQQWLNRYLGTSDSQVYDMILDGNNNICITGDCITSGGYDYLTVKYNSSGVQQWENNYNSGNFNADHSYSIAYDKFNSIYVTGSSHIPPPMRHDIVTIKYNSSGAQQWLTQYNSPFSQNDDGNVVLVDSLFNVYVSGSSYSSLSNEDFITIKYSKITIINEPFDIVNDYKLLLISSNPFNSTIKIKFQVPEEVNILLKVYDLSGKEVSTLADKRFNKGVYEVLWNASNYSSGVYFCKLSADGESKIFDSTIKMLLTK